MKKFLPDKSLIRYMPETSYSLHGFEKFTEILKTKSNHKDCQKDYILYSDDCSNDDLITMIINMPSENMDAFTLSQILKDLYIVQREINKYLGLKENFIKLHILKVEPGSLKIEMKTVITSAIVGYSLNQVCEGFAGEDGKNKLRRVGAMSRELLVDVFTNSKHILTKKSEPARAAVYDYFKRVYKRGASDITLITKIRGQNTSGKVARDNMLNFYA